MVRCSVFLYLLHHHHVQKLVSPHTCTPVYQCHYLHRAQSPSVPVSLFTLCTESVVVTCTQCTSVTIYTVHRVCCGDMYAAVYQCHYLHRAQSLLWWHVPSVPVSTIYTVHRVCCGDMYAAVVTSVTIYTVHRVCCGDMYPVYQCHYLHQCTESVVVTCTQCKSVPVSLFTSCTQSVVVTCTQCTSVTIYTVHRICCGDMYPVYQCHYLHRA